MKWDLDAQRRLLVICVAVLVVVDLILAFGVIPAVRADTYPRANPERAAAAFWGNAGIAFVVAVSLLGGRVFILERGRPGKSVLVALGPILLLAGLALVDATAAFGSHGPHMQGARVFMAIGAASEIAMGILVLFVAVRHRGDRGPGGGPIDQIT